MARWLVVCLLSLSPCLGTVAALAGDGHGHGRCTDHVCSCVRFCPPKASKSSCHGDDEVAQTRVRSAGCRHDEEGVSPVGTRPHMLPAAPALHPESRLSGAPPAPPFAVLDGFLEIDLPPPRPRS